MFYYGLTEASRSCFITFSNVDKRYYSSVGKPTSDNVSVKIINGEICIAGDHLFSGYINSDEYTIKDSYFKTGDLGYFNNDGYLFITGKKKDQLNIGGLKISSEEIKTAMLNLEEVEDVAVISVKDKFTGETPAALVVKKKEITVDIIKKKLKIYLENFAIPKKIFFIDQLPKSDTGKVIKTEVIKIIKDLNC